MKRRIWALLLSLAMTVGLLAGCGSKEAAESKGTEAASKGDKTTVEETTEETTEPVSLRLVMYGDTSTRREEFFAKDLKELLGHTPLQVFFGALLGLTIGLGGCWLLG